ncbi:Fis family transcriptional regulator [uncultured Robinsoniella sp.]|uniref:Fis family transcriptional regulator n=1 Tax=uncultured Robinsoniella sp. TaxID=904190 RepID=UPI00291002DE|nr:DUF739 domain-containing protein [Clostridiales bacterium]
MIKTDELKLIIFKNGLSQRKVANVLGMAEKTFYAKMKKGVFSSDEIQGMIDLLNIEEPIKIFFANEVTFKDTNGIKKKVG